MIRSSSLLLRIAVTVIVPIVVSAGCGERVEVARETIRLPSPSDSGGPAETIHIESDGPSRFRAAFSTMGTFARIVVVTPDEIHAQRAIQSAYDAIASVAATMSTYEPESEISRLNRDGARHAVGLSENTLRVLRAAVRFCALTGGAFDVTYAPLRSLWRRAEKQGRLPTGQEIDGALEKVGSKHLNLSGAACGFGVAGMEVDLGGIAKGFAIDLACEALDAAGIMNALVDIGGDLRVLGRCPGGEPWKVLINDPRPGEPPPLVLFLADRAVATSGDYQRYFTVDGQRLSHIVDPRTGRPVGSVPSATVIAADAITADALATAISVLGPDEALRLIESQDQVECLIMSGGSAPEVTVSTSSGFNTLCEPR